MTAYLVRVKEELIRFDEWEIHHVLQTQNTHADALSKLASSQEVELLQTVPIGKVATPSVTPPITTNAITSVIMWMDQLRAYLETGLLPEVREEARRIKYNAEKYLILND